MSKKLLFLLLSFVLLFSVIKAQAENNDIQISNIEATGISNSQFNIKWQTNGNYDCTMIYSLKDGNLDDDALVFTRDKEDYIHGSNFPKSNSGGVYNYNLLMNYQGKAYYEIICYDASGNRKISSVYSFTQSTGSLSVTPSAATVKSGETVTLNHTTHSNAIAKKLHWYCPVGIKISWGAIEDICNTWQTLDNASTYITVIMTSTATQAQNTVPNFYEYLPDNPNFAVGVSSQVTVQPASTQPPVISNYENISFFVNEDYSLDHPDWQQRAQEIIDFVNKLFKKSTNVQYKIAQFKTFSIDYQKDLNLQISTESQKNEELMYINNVANNKTPFATSIYFFAVDSSKHPGIFSQFRGTAGGYIPFSLTNKKGQKYNYHHITIYQDVAPDYQSSATILGATKVNSKLPDGWHDDFGYTMFEHANAPIIHELGHTFGCGFPEENYIFLDTIDNSGVEPKLEPHKFAEKYGGEDSMGVFLTNTIFNSYNSWIINSNLDHNREINYIPFNFKINIKDKNQKPLPNVSLSLYGARINCVFCGSDPSENNLPSPLLKTLASDKNGIINVILDSANVGNGSINNYVTLIVKVNYNNEKYGDYVSRYDLDVAKYRYNKDYEITFAFNQIAPTAATLTPETPDSSISEINTNANLLSNDKMSDILIELKQLRDTVKEQATKIKYLESLSKDVEKLSAKMESAINNFITYGVDANTQKLGAGERAAVMNSYKTAFDKLPETEAELADAIKIANGRFPSVTSDTAEKTAKQQFIKIYGMVS